jgi:hypothetical protein
MSSNRVAGRGRRCTEAIDPRNRLPRLTRPTKRREGRECVTHGCGAVRMCTCHGLESRGAYRYTPRDCKKNPQPFILLRLPGTLVHTGLARSATPASELTKAQPGSPPHAFFRLSTPIPQARGGCRLYPSPLNTGDKVKPQVKGGNGALVGGGGGGKNTCK